MPDFDNPNEKLVEFSNKLKEKAAAQSGISTPAAPINTEVAPIQPAPPAVPAQPVVTAPVAPTAAQAVPTAAVVPTPAVELSTEPTATAEPALKAWDADLFTPAKTDEPLTIEVLGSALKLEGIKSKDDIVAQFNTQKAKIKELEESRETYLTDFDDEFKEVFGIAKEKGDWKGYLAAQLGSSANIDPVQLFEQEIDKQFMKDGVFDKDGADAALAEIPLAFKRMQGEQMKRSLQERAGSRKQAILKAAEDRKKQFNGDFAEAARNLGKILPADKFGITLEGRHGDFIYDGIRTGELVEKHFGKGFDISKANPGKLARTLALAEWGEQISQHQFVQGKAQQLKEHLMSGQNVQLNSPAIPPAPNQPSLQPKTAAEKLLDRNRSQQAPNSL